MYRAGLFLLIGVPLLVLIFLAFAWLNGARAADRPESPSPAFCFAAKAAVLAAGSERAAEDAARAKGFSEATIAKAKRCKR
jgi:hypothetical protein